MLKKLAPRVFALALLVLSMAAESGLDRYQW